MESPEAQQDMVRRSEGSVVPLQSFDLNIANPTGEGEGEGHQEEGRELVPFENLASVSTDPAPSPYFDAEALTIVFPEMRSPSEEESEDSEEACDSKNKEEKKRRRLMKGGKLVNEKEVPPVLVVDVDDEEVNEEPASLIRKSSKKPVILKPRREPSVKAVEVEDVESGEKLFEKSAKKEKSVRKSMKRKVGENEEPGSSKKSKVSVAKDERIRQLVDICEFQKWTHMFTNESLKVYEEEVCSFYVDIFTVEDDNI
ncbi:uncharacterized protein [Nicotiana tomentosiformis]|uniref:uncharacterized protein n=1 Tax=Nicotiana tomentosiformis TaxID=4098 RepID=UPI00388C55CF